MFKQRNKNTFSVAVVKNTTGGIRRFYYLNSHPPIQTIQSHNLQNDVARAYRIYAYAGIRWLWNFKQIFEKLFGNKRTLKCVYRTDKRYVRLMRFGNETEDLPFSSTEQNVWQVWRAAASLTQTKPNDWTLPQTFSIVQTHFLRPFNHIGGFVVFYILRL